MDFLLLVVVVVVVFVVKVWPSISPRRSKNPFGWDDSYLAYVAYTAALRKVISNPQDESVVGAAITAGMKHYDYLHRATIPKDISAKPELLSSMVGTMSQMTIEMDLRSALRGEMPLHLTNRALTNRATPGPRPASALSAQAKGSAKPNLDETEDEQHRRVLAEPLIGSGKVELLEACERIPGSSGRFGHDITNPIPVNGIGGEFAYLNTLRARSGVGLLFHRLGSRRTPHYPHPVDEYEVVAIDASQWARLHFAMYHPRRSREVPEGFERQRWDELSDEIRAMVHKPLMGVPFTVEDFPLGLPSVVRGSGMESMANAVQRILDTQPGRWTRPEGGLVDSTPCQPDSKSPPNEEGAGGQSSFTRAPPGKREEPLPEPSPAELQDVMRTYFEVQRDEGATGRPPDYAKSLTFVPPSMKFPADWPGTPLCGCCSAPFALVARRDGMWIAEGKKDSRPVPLCAVCITHLNGLYMRRDGKAPLELPPSYDQMGQQLAAQFGAEDVRKVAVTRIAFIRGRSKDGGADAAVTRVSQADLSSRLAQLEHEMADLAATGHGDESLARLLASDDELRRAWLAKSASERSKRTSQRRALMESRHRGDPVVPVEEYDLRAFWHHYDELKRLLADLLALPGESGHATRVSAIQALDGGPLPVGLEVGGRDLVREADEALRGAEAALCTPAEYGATGGSLTDGLSDLDGLRAVVSKFKKDHAAGER